MTNRPDGQGHRTGRPAANVSFKGGAQTRPIESPAFVHKEIDMKTKPTPKTPVKSKKPARKSVVESLPVGKRQAEDIKGGRHRYK
jgi:hypothetical protein